MTLLWCDGFDHYGTGNDGRLIMLNGPWAELAEVGGIAIIEPRTTKPRTGTHSLRFSAGQVAQTARRVFGSALITVGVGAAWYLDELPSANDAVVLAQFRDAANVAQVTIILQSTGAIAVKRGNSVGVLLATSTVLMTAVTYGHLEIKVTIDNTVGAVEVRLNNVTIINISSIDTQATSNAETSQIVFFDPDSRFTVSTWTGGYLDDLFAWDTNGSNNNDFIGDHSVITLWPNGDTAATDWTRNTGANDFEAIDEADPDDDTTYVEATAAAQVSEYGLDNLPANVSTVAAIQLTGRMKKTDAGSAKVQQSLVSGASEFNGADRDITTSYTYWPDISEVDPATSVAWTKAGVDAALYKIDRTV